MSMTFTQDELFDALLSAVGPRGDEETPNSFTVREFRKARGMGDERARRFIGEARAKGLVRPEMVARRNSHGHVQRVMGYVLIDRPEPS